MRLLLVLVAACLAVPAQAAVFHSQEEALALAFPEADRVEKRNFVLTESQSTQIRELARAPVESRIVRLYVGWKEDVRLGVAVIDVHTVRTLPEALMVVLSPEGVIASVRVLAFHEPAEYAPHPRWLERFTGKKQTDPLRLKVDVDGIAGSTLSSRAVTRSLRLALAYHRVLLAEPARE